MSVKDTLGFSASKNRRTVLFIFGFLVLLGGFVYFLWPHNPTPYRLKITGQAMERGKPVMFFRVEGGDRRPVQVMGAELIIDQISQTAYRFYGWPLSQQWPITEFGVFVPTNTAVWQLRVTFGKDEDLNFKRRLKSSPTAWKQYRAEGFSLLGATWVTAKWSCGYYNSAQLGYIESDPITNSIAQH
jgi:hypothetical protein